MASKPPVAVKPGYGKNLPPALQKFMQKQEEVSEGKEVQESTPPAVVKKPTALRPPVATSGRTRPAQIANDSKVEEGNTAGSKTSVIRQTSTTSNSSEHRRVSVPKVFQNDVNSADSPKSSALSHKNSSSENSKPTVQSKPWEKSSPATTKPSTVVKPSSFTQNSSSKPASETTASAITAENKSQSTATKPSSIGVKLPVVDKQPISKVSSTVSTASSSSVSSTSSSSQPASSPTTTEPNVVDFRSHLKPVKNSVISAPVGKRNITPMKPVSSPKVPSKDEDKPVINGSSPTSQSVKPLNTREMNGPDVQLRKTSDKDSSQELKRQSSNMIVERKSDSKKFKKKKLENLPPSSVAPAKPAPPNDLDLSQIKQQYQKTIQYLKAESDAANANAVEDDDDIYTDAASEVLPRRSTFKRKSARISIIPDMSAEEEGEGPMYHEGFTPASPPPVHLSEDMYVDAVTERKTVNEDGDNDDIYEDEESFAQRQESEEDKQRRLKEEAEAKKKEEKERKEKEKEEEKRKKKEEKERAKKEKEEMQLRKKFKLTGDEKVGEGVIKQDVKGWGLGLAVKKGQIVTIVRLDQNPPNKWLIRTDTGMGYVDSNIIEVEPAIIKQIMLRSLLEANCNLEQSLAMLAAGKLTSAMVSGRKDSTTPQEDDDQPLYDDVPQDVVPEEEDDEEIYEECP